jgi:hypothetical protein
MAWSRLKIARTIMGWPQRGQVKVAETVPELTWASETVLTSWCSN